MREYHITPESRSLLGYLLRADPGGME